MNHYRIDKVVAHLRKHSEGNRFYASVLKQYELLGRISEQQLLAIEANIEKDVLIWTHKEQARLRAWNERNQP